MFIDYCDKLDDDQLDCSRRDELFNNVFTFSIIMYNLGALLGGIVNDKVGFFYGQIVNVLPNIAGLVIFAFIEHDERLIWAGWPLACFGMSGQNVMNYQFCRLGRQYYATCVALCGGCFVAAGINHLRQPSTFSYQPSSSTDHLLQPATFFNQPPSSNNHNPQPIAFFNQRPS